MRSGAFVEILGRLGSDMQIKFTRDNKHYGLISIAVNKKVGNYSESGKPIYNTKWFKAIIWNEQLIAKTEPLLKKGKKILLIGELDVIQPITLETRPQNIIIVKTNSGIAVLEELKQEDIEEESFSEENESFLPEELMS